jgi:O-antigen/teichoic acid export membrane protein
MLKASLLVFLSRNFQKAAGAAIYLLLGWRLDARGVGVYGLLVTVMAYVTTLAGLGLGPAHVHLRGQKRVDLRTGLGNLLVGSALFGAVAMALFTLLRPYLNVEFNNPLLATLITAIFPVVLLQSMLDYVWIGENRMGMYSGLYALRYVTLPLFLLIGLEAPDTLSGKYVGMALAIVANSLVSATINLWAIRREYGLRPGFDRPAFAEAARYGLHVQAGTVAQAIGYRFDVILINLFLGPAAVGLYVMAVKFAEFLWLAPAAVSTALLPRVSVASATVAQEVTARTCRLVFGVSALVGAGTWVLAGPVLRFAFGDKFAGSVAPLRLLLLGIVVFSLQKVLANYFIGQGKARWFERATLLSMAVNVGLNVLLIRQLGWGINGAAVASTVSYSLSTLILAVLFLRWSRLTPGDILVPNRSDLAQLTAVLGDLRRRAQRLGHGGVTR